MVRFLVALMLFVAVFGGTPGYYMEPVEETFASSSSITAPQHGTVNPAESVFAIYNTDVMSFIVAPVATLGNTAFCIVANCKKRLIFGATATAMFNTCGVLFAGFNSSQTCAGTCTGIGAAVLSFFLNCVISK